jgi:hypothetical protein
MIFTVTKWKSRKKKRVLKAPLQHPSKADADGTTASLCNCDCSTEAALALWHKKRDIGFSWYYRVQEVTISDGLGYGQCKALSAACWMLSCSRKFGCEVGCEASIPSCWLEWLEMQLHGNAVQLSSGSDQICHHLPHGRPICWRTLSRHHSSGMAMTAKQLHCDPCHSYTHSTSIGGAGFNLGTQKLSVLIP